MIDMKNLVRGKTETIALEKMEPNIEAILKIQGYKDPGKVRPAVLKAAKKATQTLTEIVFPTVSYRVVNVESVDDSRLVLGNGAVLESRIFQQYLSESKEAVVFALTVGKKVDDQTIQWMDDEMLVEALFLESAAWLGVEQATKEFVIAVRRWAHQQQLRITRRLGPGYSYPINGEQVQWDLTDQMPLFSVFDDMEIPVSLLESAAMIPKMSRSGLYGLVPE